MKLYLDKEDLISLVKGTDPNLNVMGHPKIRCRGNYNEPYGTWDWSYRAFEGCSETEIYEIYQLCKNSWK
jgi:hypothetical protein